jgi:GntR family transcriptional regulator
MTDTSDRLSPGPLPRYYQLKELLRQRIRSGEWPPDTLIPSERELCEQYGLSRMTARQSLTELVNEGLLYRRQGRGTFVGRPRIAQQLLRLTGFTQDMRARGQRPGATVLSAELCRADSHTAEVLRLKPGQAVFRLRRLRSADGEPLAIETSVVAFLGCERLREVDLAANSLYQILEERFHLSLQEAEQEVEADLATEADAALLGIAVGAPVLRVRRVTFDQRRQPVEFATSVYRGDRYTFYARLVRDGIEGAQGAQGAQDG